MLADNKITKQIESYIEYKQSLGYQLRIESQELRRFAKYTREIEHSGSITVDLACDGLLSMAASAGGIWLEGWKHYIHLQNMPPPSILRPKFPQQASLGNVMDV